MSLCGTTRLLCVVTATNLAASSILSACPRDTGGCERCSKEEGSWTHWFFRYGIFGVRILENSKLVASRKTTNRIYHQ